MIDQADNKTENIPPIAQHHKDSAVGQNKSKLSQHIEQWLQPGRIIDDNEQQHIHRTLDNKHEGGKVDTLQWLLLDGGQGKNNKSNEQQKATSTGDMDATRHLHQWQQLILKQAKHKTNRQCNQGQSTVQ